MLVAPDLDHRRLARGAKQCVDHPIGAAAEEAGQPDELTLAHTDMRHPIGARFDEQLTGRTRRGKHLARRASGHRLHEIVHREGAAGGDRRHPPIAQYRAAVGDCDHLVETMGTVDDGGALPLHAREHRK